MKNKKLLFINITILIAFFLVVGYGISQAQSKKQSFKPKVEQENKMVEDKARDADKEKELKKAKTPASIFAVWEPPIPEIPENEMDIEEVEEIEIEVGPEMEETEHMEEQETVENMYVPNQQPSNVGQSQPTYQADSYDKTTQPTDKKNQNKDSTKKDSPNKTQPPKNTVNQNKNDPDESQDKPSKPNDGEGNHEPGKDKVDDKKPVAPEEPTEPKEPTEPTEPTEPSDPKDPENKEQP